MNKIYFILFFCLLNNNAFSQNQTYTFEGNNFRWNQNTNGVLFNNSELGLGGLEVPIDSSTLMMHTQPLLISGLDSEGNIHGLYQKFCLSDNLENCFQTWGPLPVSAIANEPSEVESYNKIWFVTLEQTNLHSAYFDCLENPDCNVDTDFPSYEIPSDFMDWPAQGDTDFGYAEYLAPFFDRDGDGTYDASNGDLPMFCGDFASYAIHNDVGTDVNSTSNRLMGVEVHTQVYGYDADVDAVFNTLFVKQKVINRSDTAYSDVYIGTNSNIDVGGLNDDFLGCDVGRSMLYGYNGDDFDQSNSTYGYGADLPIIGIRYLGGPLLDSDGLDNEALSTSQETYGNQGPGWSDGIVDNERLGLGSFISHEQSSGNSAINDPYIDVHYYNYLSGKWRDGTPVTYGGTGFDLGNGVNAKFMFDGLSDPLFQGTDGDDPLYSGVDGWTEVSENSIPGDRTSIAGTGPFTFAPGESQTLDYAMIFAQESHDDDLTVLETLQAYADEIVGMQCGEIPDVTTGIIETPKELNFKAFPNPATDMVNIQLPKTFEHVRVEVLDMQSRVIYSRDLSQTDKGQINLDMARGQYILRVIADGEVGVDKLTKM